MSMDETGEKHFRTLLSQRDRQLDSIHRITATLGTITDLNDLVREALRVSMDCVGARDGSVILHDPEKDKLVFTYVIGAKAAELTGMEMETGQGLAGAVFQSGSTRVSENVAGEADHDQRISQQIEYSTRNMVTVPLKCMDGRTIGVMQVLNREDGPFDNHDVDVLDILGTQIATALESARLYNEARVAEIVRFIGNLSHDVKNMVTPAQTGADTLKIIADEAFDRIDALVSSCANPSAEDINGGLDDLRCLYGEMIEMIMDGCLAVQERMAEISAAVKGVVSEPAFERQSLCEVVRRALKPLELVGEKADVVVVLDCAEDIPDADIDGKQIYNAVYNMVNNAIQATPAGGSVTVAVNHQADSPLSAAGVLELVVSDTGQGMPEDILARAFTENAVSTRAEGTGLGTKIVKNVMDAHSAEIVVQSELGRGTTICCLIPVERPACE